MATFSLFTSLPSEIQILILRHYFPQWTFSITVAQSRIVPANFRIGTGCPFNFIFGAAGRRDDICALWTSRDLHELATRALEQSFTGTVKLITAGNWHFPQRIPMFRAFVLPGLPAGMIKTIELDTEPALDERQKLRARPKNYLSWREMIEFVDFDKMPNLECLRICVSHLALNTFDFKIGQIGDVLRGEHDESIMEWIRANVPEVRPDQKKQIMTPSGRPLVLEVATKDVIRSWVPLWFSTGGTFYDITHMVSQSKFW